MKITNATWEKRNLDVECVEITAESNDSVPDIKQTIENSKKEYLVVKVPSKNPLIGIAAQDLGCRYIETNIHLTKSVRKKPVLGASFQRYEYLLSYHVADDSELERIMSEIGSGRIFTTDKIALDPRFSKELSGRRYSLWAEDILKSDGKAYCVTYQDKAIGFIINEYKDGYMDCFLAALFDEYSSSGLGLFVIHTIEKIAYDCGYKKIETGVSSNNLAVLRLYMELQYFISGMTAIYIWHK